MKVIAYCFVNKKHYTFGSVEEAAKFTRISEARILACIRNGQKWRMWIFDEGF